MSQKTIFWILGIMILLILIIGIGVVSLFWVSSVQEHAYQVPTLDPAVISSQAAQTVIAEITRQAMANSATVTNTSAPIAANTSTTTPIPTATATPTPEIVIPSRTPFPTLAPATLTPVPPTIIVPSFTPKPVVCDRAQLIRELSVEDNSPLAPGTTFVKTWRLKNVGGCSWTSAYDLVFRTGDPMDANLSIPLPTTVKPDQLVDVSVTLKAPKKYGIYRGDWMLSNQSGTRFGTGPNGDKTFWVQIQVADLVNDSLAYDFAGNYCQAEWNTGGGRIPCPGTSSAVEEGYVVVSDSPRLENRNEDEWALITHPNSTSRGWISGIYPAYQIRPNDHFTAWVGCLADSKGCNVNFRLDFKNLANGNVRNLGSWREVFDGQITKIYLDLSEHAGKKVRFILSVEISGGNPALANAFWFVPGIVQGPPPTMTPTSVPPSATPTATLTETPTEIPTETPTETP
ncbi:MAG: NBR1-Ig-like domain-containing protein [Anaerolineales bacterium]